MTAQPQLTPRRAGSISAFEPSDALQTGYLLVDPGALPDGISLTALAALPCTPTNWEADLTGLPAAIDLAQCEPSQRDWLASVLQNEHTQRKCYPLAPPSICAHLMASASCAEVATHLAQQLLVLPIDKSGYRSGAPCLWRLFDPRVFANLCWMLDPEHHHALLGPISAWAFPWFDHWFTLKKNQPWRTPSEDGPNPSSVRPRPVDMDMWQRAQRIAQINQVLARLALSPDISWEQRSSTAQCIESALATAKHRLHWDHLEDQMGYAESAIRYGNAFLDHPRLATYWTLREERKASGSWSEAASVLTDDDYQALNAKHSTAHRASNNPPRPSPEFVRT